MSEIDKNARLIVCDFHTNWGKATITRCDLSATILFKLVDS